MLRSLVVLLVLAVSPGAIAQSLDVSVLFDQAGGGGCTVSGVSSLPGIDARLDASVDVSSGEVSALTLRRCVSGAFEAPVLLDGPYPVGLNNGVSGADVVELSVGAGALGGGSAQYAVTVLTDSAGSQDEATVGFAGVSIPIPTSPWALALLALILCVVALLAVMRFQRASVVVLSMVALSAWAAHFVLDGQVSDWLGVNPVSDPDGDASAGGSRADIIAVFAAQENNQFWFRVDLADIENLSPVARNDAFAVDEDSVLSGANLLADNGSGADSDPDGDALTVTAFDGISAEGVTVSVAATGELSYDPSAVAALQALAAGESASDQFAYTISDGRGGLSSAIVSVGVSGVNDVPTAVADVGAGFSTSKAVGFTTASVLANDTDPDASDVLIVAAVDTTGTLGLISDNGNGTFDYDPNGQFAGLGVGDSASDTFAYTVSDGNGGTSTASVTISIAGANTAPVAQPDAFATDEDTALAGANVLADNGSGADSDLEADPLTVTAFDALSADGASVSIAANGDLSYDPTGAATLQALAAGESLSDTFSYTVSDGNGGSASATVTVSVSGINDTPTANADAGIGFVGNEDSAFTTASVLGNDTDPDASDTLSVSALDTGATSGLVGNNADGTFSYDPNGQFESLAEGATGTDVFSYTVIDGNGGSDTASVSIQIDGVNDAPDLVLNTAGVNFAGTPVALAPAATLSDVDSDRFSVLRVFLNLGTNCDPFDAMSIENQGSGVGQVGFDGTIVSFEGTPISDTVQAWACTDPGTGAQDALDISLNSAADTAATQALIRALQFTSSSADSSQRAAQIELFDDFAGFDVVTQIVSLDQAPVVTSPIDGETNADPSTSITVNFSESVEIAMGAFALVCDSSSVAFSTTPALPASGVTTVDVVPNAALAAGAVCSLTVTASAISDSDAMDPPDTPASDAVFGFAVESPPEITSVVPAAGATGVAPGEDVVVTFSEPVDLNGNWFSLQCGAATYGPSTGNIVISSNDASNSVVTLNPNSDFPLGSSCQIDVFADASNGVTDQDTVDGAGLDLLDGNNDGTGGDDFFSTFSVEAAPTVSSTVPVDAASNVAGDIDIVVTFSEPVSASAASFALDCAGAIAVTPVANGAQDQYTLTPGSTLPAGSSCSVTVVAAQISDNDSIDPPDQLDGNADGTTGDDFQFSFTVDAAPSLSGAQAEVSNVLTTIGDGTVLGGVDDDTTVVLSFSEAVNVTSNGLSLSCANSGAVSTASGLSIAGDGSDTITLSRTAGTFAGGETCTLGFVLTEINDADSNDPPDNLQTVAGSYQFEIAPVASDDARNVSTHLQASYTDTTAGGNDDHLLVNDTCAGCTLTFGESDATANAAGSVVTLASGAIVSVANDGSFSFNPAPGDTASATDSFVYRVTTANGGFDEATVTMTVSGPVVWFVDGSNASGIENGTLAYPFTQFGGMAPSFDASASDAASQSIFVADYTGTYTCGVTLLDGQQLIGSGAASTLAALTGLSPVAETSVALPTTGGNKATLVNGSGDCLTLGVSNTVRGINIGNTGGYAFVDGGASVGNLTITDSDISGSGGLLSLANGGTLAASFDTLSSSDHNDSALSLQGAGGSLTSTSGSVVSTANAPMLSVAGGSVSMTLANSLAKTGGSGAALSFSSGHTGSVQMNGAVTGSAGSGLQFNNADGSYTITGLVSLSNGSAGVNIENSSDGSLSITDTNSSINQTQGIPLRINDSAMAVNYDGEIEHRSPALLSSRAVEAIDATGLISLDGDVIVGDNMNRATATAVYLSNTGATNTLTISLLDSNTLNAEAYFSNLSGNLVMRRMRARCDGDLGLSSSTYCVSVSDSGSSGFTVERLDAALADAGDNGGALSLTNTTGTWTVEALTGGSRLVPMVDGNNFGTLNIGTVDDPATGDSPVPGTITADQAAVVSLINGQANIRWQSISAFNTTTGLSLTTVTGTGFEVVGDGSTAGSGGSIPNMAGDAITLTDSSNIRLDYMTISNSAANGILGSNVTNLAMTGTQFTGNGDAVNEGALRFANLLGTSSITNSTISGSAENNIEITNTAGTLSSLAIAGSTISTNSSALGADGLLLETRNSAVANVVVTGSTFDDNQADAIQINAIDTSSASLTIDDTTFTSTTDASSAGSVSARALNLTAASNASLRFDIGVSSSNVFENFSPSIGEEAINLALVSTSTASARLTGRIANNSFTNSGGAVGADLRGNGAAVISITGNTASTARQPIDIITGDAVGDAATLDLTVLNNGFTANGTGANPNNEAISIFTTRDTAACVNVRGNTGVASGTREDIALDPVDASVISLESGATDCGGGVCASDDAHLLANNTITDVFSTASLTAVGTCATP